MTPKRRRIASQKEPTILPFFPTAIELVFQQSQSCVLSMDHVAQSITNMLLSSPKSNLEKATEENLPDVVRWLATKANKERNTSSKSTQAEYREARFLAGIFESAKIGNIELIKAWFMYLPEAADLATAKIFEVAVREGHVNLLEWLLEEGKLQNDEMIASSVYSHASVMEWLRERFPTIKLTISLDQLAERWTGPDALAFMQKIWSQKRKYKKIQVSAYAKFLAAIRGDIEMLKWVNTIRKGKCQAWAVRLAAENGHVETFKWLLENVYSYRVSTDSKRTFSWEYEVIGIAVRRGHLETVKLLNSKFYNQCINLAVGNGYLDMVKWFYENGEITSGPSSRQIAASKGHLEVLQWLHDRERLCDVTPFEMANAALGGHLHVIQWLHSKGCGCSTTAMDNAARGNRLDIIQWLHNNRSEGCTTSAMDEAASQGWLDIVFWLHENRTEGCTAHAMIGAAGNGHLEMVQWLHENTTKGCEAHALCRAVFGGHMSVVQWLCAHGIGVCGCKLMNSAVQTGNLELVKWVHSNRPETRCDSFITVAVTRGHFQVLKWLITNELGEIDRANIYAAISANHLHLAKWLHATYPSQFSWTSREIGSMYDDPLCADFLEWLILKDPQKVATSYAVRCLRKRTEYPLHPAEVMAAKAKRRFSRW